MGKTVQIMMKEVRRDAHVDEERYDDLHMMKHFNDAQEEIRSIIHTSDGTGKFFPKEFVMDIQPNKRNYPLPNDCYLFNSINSVEILSDDVYRYGNQKLAQITIADRTIEYGYYAYGRNIRLSYDPQTSGQLRINYAMKLPSLSPRAIEIKRIDGIKIHAVRDSFFLEKDLLDYADQICIVDRRGNIVCDNLDIDGYVIDTGQIRLVEPLEMDLPAGRHWVSLGYHSSTHTSLPDEALPILTRLAERRIKAIDSDEGFQKANFITEKERARIMDLFAESENDVNPTPVGSGEYFST